MKVAAIGNCEIRDARGDTIARFNTFGQAVRACVISGWRGTYHIFECEKGGKRAASWIEVATYELET